MMAMKIRYGDLFRVGPAIIRITEVSGRQVLVHIDAPKEMSVNRISDYLRTQKKTNRPEGHKIRRK